MKNILLLLIVITFSCSFDLTKDEKNYLNKKKHLSVMNVDKFQPFSFVQNNEPAGYTVDIMTLIGKQINKKIIFVTDPWEKQLDNLDNGSIDIIPYIVKTQEQQKKIDFTNYTHITFFIGFAIDKNNNIESMNDLDGKIVAVVKKSFMYEHLKKNFPNIKLYLTNNVQESLEAVVRKKAFTALDNMNTINYLINEGWLNQLKITTIDDLGLPHSNKLNMGVKKGNIHLKSILEKVYKNLPIKEVEKIKLKWFSQSDTFISLTEEEQDYLDNKPFLSVMSLQKFHPFSFIQDGKPVGYTNDILRLYGKILGKEIKFIRKPWKKQLEMLKENKLDFIPYMVKTDERMNYIAYTKFEHLNFLIGFATNVNNKISSMADLKGKKIAVVNKYFFHDHLKDNYPNIPLLVVNSTQEAIEAVAQNKAYAVLDNITTLNYIIKETWLKNMKITSVDDLGLPYTNKLYMAVKKDNKVLKSILEKVDSVLSEKKVSLLRKKWFINEAMMSSLTKKEKEFLANKPYISVTSMKNFQPFNFVDKGEFYGYSVDTMKLIGTILGKDIKFIDKPWSEQLQMLKNGTLDVIPHIAVNENRKKFVDYTNFSHLTFLIGFAIKKDTDINSMQDFKGKTIAVVNKYYLHDHLKKVFPNIKLLVTNSSEEAIEAVIKNKAFAVIDNIPTLNYFIEEKWLTNLKIDSVHDLGLPLETKMSMGVKKGNVLLKSILEKANHAISHYERAKLKQSWMILNRKEIVTNSLSTKEMNYLKKKKKVLMCVLPDWLPFEQIDKNGEHNGIGADFIKIISKYIDTPIELIPTKEWSESLQNIKERKCDILPVAMNIPSRRELMNFTKPYISEPFVVATKANTFFIKDVKALSNKKIGIVKSYAFIEVLKSKNPSIEIVNVKNSKEGLERVRSGELFGYVDTMPTIGYAIQKYSMLDLKIAGKLEFDITLSIASRNDEPLLNSLMQKAIDSISKEQKRSIIGKWISIKVTQEFDYAILWKVSGAFFIILLSVLIYKNRLVNKINNKLEKRTKSLNKQTKKVTDLLNNAAQGFLSFDKDFLIDEEYSLECEYLLGKNLKEKDIAELLFHNNLDRISFFKETVIDVLQEKNELTASLLLTLLPSEMIFNKRAILIEYKILSDNKIMMILTNITDKKKLMTKIKTEQNILKMIVAIVSDSSHFYETKESFDEFCIDYLEFLNTEHSSEDNANTINALIHTFKGLFAQLYMKNTVKNLHKIETELYLFIESKKTYEDLAYLIKSHELKKFMDEDLLIIRNSLGQNFLEEYNQIKVDEKLINKLEDKMLSFSLLNDEQKQEWEEIFFIIKKIKNKSLHHYLSVYSRVSQQLAISLNKSIHPFEIIGDKNTLMPDNFKAFVNSLIHVFRNCCDHGIETKEKRIELKKSEIGNIHCEFKKTDNKLSIIISDDGAGINIDSIKEKILKKKLCDKKELDSFTTNEIIGFIFNPNFSTHDKITSISGRGIGLSAVNFELSKLNGTVSVKTEINKGTTFTFNIPLSS